jgi:hypothetical protein
MGPIGTVKSSVVMMLPGTGAISGTFQQLSADMVIFKLSFRAEGSRHPSQWP